jgi:hypothetical protein
LFQAGILLTLYNAKRHGSRTVLSLSRF